MDDRLSRGVGLHARALVALQLEELEETGFLAGSGDDPRIPVGIDEQNARGIGVDEFDAPIGEHRQEVDDVEVVDQGVGKL